MRNKLIIIFFHLNAEGNNIMNEMVVKDNAFIEASLNLDLVEQRIILLAIIKARQNSDNVEETLSKEFIIHASEYIHTFNVEKHTAYESLKNGVKGLLDAKFLYRYENKNKNIAHRGYNLTSWVEYVDNEACVSVKFSPDVVPLIVGLNKKFTSYELQQIVNLKSRYAIRLYELLIRWRDTRKLIITLEELRFCLGIQKNEYKLMSNFKTRVLDLAVQQINQHTDIEVSYEQKKEGRKIKGFEFTFIIKPSNKADVHFILPNPDKKRKVGRPRKQPDSLNNENLLSAHEASIAEFTANEYINRHQITDENHIQNIHMVAKKEGWGLDKHGKKNIVYERQNQDVDRKMAEDNLSQKNLDEQMDQSEKSNNQFIKTFEALSKLEQESILESVGKKVSKIPIFGKQFKELREINAAHKDIMFRTHFKEVMGLKMDE